MIFVKGGKREVAVVNMLCLKGVGESKGVSSCRDKPLVCLGDMFRQKIYRGK